MECVVCTVANTSRVYEAWNAKLAIRLIIFRLIFIAEIVIFAVREFWVKQILERFQHDFLGIGFEPLEEQRTYSFVTIAKLQLEDSFLILLY